MSHIGKEIVLVGKSPREAMLNMAHGPTFPFFVLNLKKGEKSKAILDFELPNELYEIIVKRMGTNQIYFYHDLRNSKTEGWSPSMHFSLDILRNYRMMSSTSTWLKNAINFMVLNINEKTQEKTLQQKSIKNGLDHASKLLSYAGLLEKLKGKTELVSITRDVIKSEQKDPDSIIYRLAMMIYHSSRVTGEPAMEEIEDPGSIYLSLMDQYNFSLNYEFAYNKLLKISTAVRSGYIKTFICFIIGAYLYYYVANELIEG